MAINSQLRGPVYADLNLEWKEEPQKLHEIVKTALALGYQRIAFNNYIEEKKTGKGNKKQAKEELKKGCDLLLNEETVKDLQAQGHQFEQLSRVTIATQANGFNGRRISEPECLSYDIIAVYPQDEKSLMAACRKLEVDIICLNLEENHCFMQRNLFRQAAARGTLFEVCYSPALLDSSVKRNLLTNALELVNAIGGKNIIISSGAKEALDLRSPYDVVNLGKLFGLSDAEAKKTVGVNPRAVLKHSEARKTFRTVVSVSQLSSLHPDERKLVESQVPKQNKMEDSDDNESDDESEDEYSEEEEDQNGDEAPQVKRLKT